MKTKGNINITLSADIINQLNNFENKSQKINDILKDFFENNNETNLKSLNNKFNLLFKMNLKSNNFIKQILNLTNKSDEDKKKYATLESQYQEVIEEIKKII